MDQRTQEPQIRMRTLTEAASDVKTDREIPIHRYLRSGAEMLQKAELFFGQGNLESAYILYMKYLTLFIEKLHEHPEYAKLTADEKNQLIFKVREVLAHTEELKKQLLKKFHDEREDYLKSLN